MEYQINSDELSKCSKDIIFYICDMLDVKDILNCRLSKKINGHISKYIYKNFKFIYDDGFMDIFGTKDIHHLKFKHNFNKDISNLVAKPPLQQSAGAGSF